MLCIYTRDDIRRLNDVCFVTQLVFDDALYIYIFFFFDADYPVLSSVDIEDRKRPRSKLPNALCESFQNNSTKASIKISLPETFKASIYMEERNILRYRTNWN